MGFNDITSTDVSYNGYTFPGVLESRVSVRPEMDRAGRVIKYVEYSISIETVIVPDSAPQSTAGEVVANNMEDIRLKLTEQGQALSFKTQGFGDFIVNTEGDIDSVNDVKNGPIPELLVWEPIAGGRAVRIIWRVRTHLPECERTIGATNLMELAYEIQFSIDKNGLTTRTISGTMEIPSSRISDSKFGTTIDDFRSKINPIPLPGFHRTQDWKLSADKRLMDFTIVDTEIPSDNAYARGMIDIDVSHRLASNFMKDGFYRWTNTISGSITIAPGMGRHTAYLVFLEIVRARTRQHKLAFRREHIITNKIRTVSEGTFIPLSISIEEEIYGRTMTFSFDYILFSSPEKAVLGSGLFTPVGINTWKTWINSLNDTMTHLYGRAKLRHKANDDTLINLCLPGNLAFLIDPEKKIPPKQEVIFKPDCPTPSDSWFDVQINLTYEEETNQVICPKLGGSSIDAQPIQRKGTSKKWLNQTTSTTQLTRTTSASEETTIQLRGPATHKVNMTGFAVRVGFPITVPVLYKYSGRKAYKGINNTNGMRKITTGECPIYLATWDHNYLLLEAPSPNSDANLDTELSHLQWGLKS